MNTDQCQVNPEEQQQERKPRLGFYVCPAPTNWGEQQESTTIVEEKDNSEDAPINFNQPTLEGVVAEMTRGARLNSIKVATLSGGGAIEYRLIPTRPYWLSMVRHDWGSTDDEIKASIAVNPTEQFTIEVCGTHKGYGVIVRDIMRNPIIVISRAVKYVSPFYNELQGVSLGLKLARKYKISYFGLDCLSEHVAEYVRRSWNCKYKCDSKNPREVKDYCVKCSRRIMDNVAAAEWRDADKILSLLGEIIYDGLELELEREGCELFNLSPTTIHLSRAKGVWHLAKSGINQELRLNEIDKHAEIAEILYKEVYGHGSEEELMLHLKELKLTGRF